MKKIGIIGAMPEEVQILKDKMELREVIQKANMEFYTGVLQGKEVVIVQSGIGKVNAGICTQILVDLFRIDCVINTGVAGSLRAEINIGDIVVSTDAVHHDMDVQELGYAPGQVPDMDVFSFKADERLVELAESVCREVNPDIQVFRGRVASGDQFVAGKEEKERIVKQFDASCTEMEGAAIAQGAWLNKIPYVVLRAISDKADNSATMDYPSFKEKAIRHSVNLTELMVKQI